MLLMLLMITGSSKSTSAVDNIRHEDTNPIEEREEEREGQESLRIAQICCGVVLINCPNLGGGGSVEELRWRNLQQLWIEEAETQSLLKLTSLLMQRISCTFSVGI
jgi:hypothetical protein